jgi:hypothetical protein
MYTYKRLVDDSVEKVSGNYTIECLPDHSIYYGKSLDCWNRWEEHKRDLRNGSEKPLLLAKYKKYGMEALEFNIYRRSQFAYKVGEMDALNRYYELQAIYNDAPQKGIVTLNEKSEESLKLYLLLDFIINSCEYTVIAVQRDIDNKVKGGKRVCLVYEDDDMLLHNIDLHSVNSDIFNEHKLYCEQRGVEFTHFDNGINIKDKHKAMFMVKVDGYNVKPKSK